MAEISSAKQPPEAAVRALAAIDPRLSIRWVDGALSYWAITQRWLDNDPRRERIKKSELPHDMDFDIVKFVPEDCSPYEMEGLIARTFVRVNDPKKQATEAAESVEKANKDHQTKLQEAFVDEQGERGAKTTKHELEVQAGLATANAQVTVPVTVTGGKGKRK